MPVVRDDAILESVLSIVESTLPVAAMLQEPQKTIDGSVATEPPVEIDLLVDMMLHAEQYFIRTGKSTKEARKLVLFSEPFVRFRDAMEVHDCCEERTQGQDQENVQ